jgi:carboxyl-terminal processing protease
MFPVSIEFEKIKNMLKRVFLGLFIAATIACTAAPRLTNIDVRG